MRALAGSWVSWRSVDYEVMVISPTFAILRSDEGVELEVSRDELDRSVAPSSRTAGRFDLRELTEEVIRDEEAHTWWMILKAMEDAVLGGATKEAAVRVAAREAGARLGRSVSSRTVYRRLEDFERYGLVGLVDGRRPSAGRAAQTGRTDPRVIEVINEVLESRAVASTVSKDALIRRILRLTQQRYGADVRLPSRATFHRILKEEDVGRGSFGSAKTRESLSLRHDRTFKSRQALRPGEQTQIDSTTLDVLVRIDETTIARPELTILVDVATRSILSAVLRPEGTKSVDLVVVLARALVPYSRRPEGARETRRLISTSWVEDALLEQEQFERLRNQQPFIFPETITTDRGSNYLSAHFLAACGHLQIGTITASTHTPTDKPHVERTFKSINTMFLGHIRGYTGRSVEHRGKDLTHDSDQLLTIAQMQELLEDWVAVVWQNKVHHGLRDPLEPTIALSPNQMCRAFRRRVPELQIPLTREDFIALLPTVERRINRYGVTIDHRVYDSSRLDPYRRRASDSKHGRGRWSIRVDPYNLHVVWLDADGEFIPLHWSNEIHRMPMLGEVWRLAREEYRETGIAAPEARLSDAILDFASRGNPKGSGVKSARIAAAEADPMHLTAGMAPGDEEQGPAIGVTEVPYRLDEDEPWPNQGGFELIVEPSEGAEE